MIDIHYGFTAAASLKSMRLMPLVRVGQLVDLTGQYWDRRANECRTTGLEII